MSKDDGGPAFPIPGTDREGMTLRDWFAGQALQAIMADAMRIPLSETSPNMKDVAEKAYQLGDAMLEARKVIGTSA